VPRDALGGPYAESRHPEGVAAKLHMQDLMNRHTQQALAQQSMQLQRRLSRFRQIMREITDTTFFDIMVALLVLADMACLVIQQEFYSEDGIVDGNELLLRGVSAAIITAFGVEFLARAIAYCRLRLQWMLLLDGVIVVASFVEVFWSAVAPESSPVLAFLRPLRGLRLLRAVRGCVKLLRHSALADLAFAGLTRAFQPLLVAMAVLGMIFLLSSVIMTLQVPGVLDELEDEDVKRDVLDKFGTMYAATATLLSGIAGSHDLGTLCLRIYTQTSRGRLQLALFLGTIPVFVLVMGLSLGGVVCGVLVTQLLLLKGDVEVDGGVTNFKKNQMIVHGLDKAMSLAGHLSGDNIDWDDVLSVLCVNENQALTGKAVTKELQGLLTVSPESEAAREAEKQEENNNESAKELSAAEWEKKFGDNSEAQEAFDAQDMPDIEDYRCILEHKGVTMEDLQAAYHELSLFGPVCVEDFILCVFKHACNVKTLPALSYNHQQNRVYARLLLQGTLFDQTLREAQNRVGMLNQSLQPMITETLDTVQDLAELRATEDLLQEKQEALNALLAEKSKDQGYAAIPKGEIVQARRDGQKLHEMLQELEKQVDVLEGTAGLPPTDRQTLISSLADELAENAWEFILQELRKAG